MLAPVPELAAEDGRSSPNWRHYLDRLDIPAAPEVVAAWFADAAQWPALLPGLQGGSDASGWRWRGDACVPMHTTTPDGSHLRLHGHLGRTLLVLRLTLRPHGAATDARVLLSVPVPAAWLGRRLNLPGRLASRVFAALARVLGTAFPPTPSPLPTLSSTELDDLVTRLTPHFPRTVAAFQELPGGLAALRRVYDLTRHWQQGDRPMAGLIDRGAVPALPARDTFDVIVAGGVMGLLYATALTCLYGRRVLVFDRHVVGCTHREWNISAGELAVLVRLGLFSEAELAGVVARRYAQGRVRFHAGGISVPPAELLLDDVLNVAIDADAMLALCLRRFTAAGGTVRSGHSFRRAVVVDRGPTRVLVETESAEGPCAFVARLLIDTMGAASPIAAALTGGGGLGGVCPTVGTVATGFVSGSAPDTVDPAVGDVLVSVADSMAGRQHIWEAFPGRGDAVTVYLFYYDRAQGRARRDANLLALYEDYFALLPTYKRLSPTFRHLRPVYGYIPARHRDRWRQPPVETVAQGIVSLGDAAAQQSALTFCGFGSAVRSVARVAPLVDRCLRDDLLEARHLRHITAAQPNLGVIWVFSRFMQPRAAPVGRPAEVNDLMNVFCAALRELGPDLADRFFKDRFGWRDYTRLVLHTARRYPAVFPRTLSTLGVRDTALWGVSYLEFSAACLRDGLVQTALNVVGHRRVGWAERRWPALGLRLAAHRLARQAQQGWPDLPQHPAHADHARDAVVV
jgi:lycopene cyclase CruA